MKNLTTKEKELLKKFENKKTSDSKNLKSQYLAQTDKNYKDGDRN